MKKCLLLLLLLLVALLSCGRKTAVCVPSANTDGVDTIMVRPKTLLKGK